MVSCEKRGGGEAMETKVKPAVETGLCRGYLFLMLALLPLPSTTVFLI